MMLVDGAAHRDRASCLSFSCGYLIVHFYVRLVIYEFSF